MFRPRVNQQIPGRDIPWDFCSMAMKSRKTIRTITLPINLYQHWLGVMKSDWMDCSASQRKKWKRCTVLRWDKNKEIEALVET